MIPPFRSSALLPALFCAGSVALFAGCIIIPVPLPPAAAKSWPLTIPVGAATPSAGQTKMPGPVPQPACPTPAGSTALESGLIAQINSERRAAGVGPLTSSPRLRAIAQDHACHNAQLQSISHTGAGGLGLGARMRAGGYHGARMAENTGLGFAQSPGRMLSYWMASPAHRANLLHPGLTEAGLGYARSATGKPAWVLDLGTPR